MRKYGLLALIWCAPASAVSLADAVPENLAVWTQYPESLLRSVTHYLASTLQFSGDSVHTDESANGRLRMAGNDMILSRHDIALDFEDSVSRTEGGEWQSLALRYGFPVGGVDFDLTVKETDQHLVTTRSGQQLDTRVDYRGLDLSGSRALWSWKGFEVDGVFSHATGTSDWFEESSWTSETDHQLSSLALRCSGQRELAGGFRAGSTAVALAGFERLETATSTDISEQSAGFYRVTLGASLNRSWHAWDLGIQGRYQVAPPQLASSEYLQIAGPVMMHGFNGQSMHVAEGGWLRMNARSPGYAIPFTSALNSRVTFSVLRGWAPARTTGLRRFEASSGEIALQLEGRGFNASMSVGQILDLSGEAMERPDTPDVSLSLSMVM